MALFSFLPASPAVHADLSPVDPYDLRDQR